MGAKPQVSGGELTVDDDSMKKTVKARHVKTYVKRFLWKKGERKNYRVLVEGKELRLIELEPSEAEEEERKKEEKEKEGQEEEIEGGGARRKQEEPETKIGGSQPRRRAKPRLPPVEEEREAGSPEGG